MGKITFFAKAFHFGAIKTLFKISKEIKNKYFKGEKKVVYIFAGLLAFFYCYQYVGLPMLLAKATAMGKSHPPRVESSVMILQLLLLSYFLKNCNWKKMPKQRLRWGTIISFVIPLVFLAGTVYHFYDDQVGVYLIKGLAKGILLSLA